MQEIKNNPHVYTAQESTGMQEIKNYPQDINTCFYKLNYLGCNLGMKFISFWNETHLIVWGWTIRFLMLGGGGGSFTNCNYVFSSIKPVVDFFEGNCPTTPPPFPPPFLHKKSNGPFLICYLVLQLFIRWKNLDIYVLLVLLLFFLYYQTNFKW